MDDLRHALHAAAAEPPPTRIDLDELIDSTRRRSRFQYRIGAVAGAVALTTGALLVPTVLLPSGGLSTAGGGAPPRGCPTFSPAPIPIASLGVVAGPTYDPSVPAASRNPTPDPSEPVDTSPTPSPPATATPVPSATEPGCVRPGPAISCQVDSSGPQPSERALDVVVCNRFVPALREASDKAFPAEWRLTQAMILPIEPNGYSITLVVVAERAGIAMKVQVKLDKEQPGNVLGRCAALAATVHAKAGDCKVQREGDAVLVTPTRPMVYDVRPDGTTLSVAANPPATADELTTFARTARVSAAN